MTVENTAKRDPLTNLVGLMSDGSDEYITGMEAAGQRQLVNSELLPTDLGGGEEDFEALGLALGATVAGDPLFRHVTLPPGWSRQLSDHSMWSYIVDEYGRQRIGIFYKAAFYDRSARANITSVHSYVAAVARGENPLVIDGAWATKDAVRQAIDSHVELWRQYAEDNEASAAENEEFREHYLKSAAQDRELLASFETLARREELA